MIPGQGRQIHHLPASIRTTATISCSTARWRAPDGPYTFGTYLWARFNNLTKWERKLIDGPYIHHMAEVEGDYTWELREFCRLIPHLDSDTVD